MKVSYEEKTYENYFNAELGRRTSVYFPLGQVQEGYLGFDSAGLSWDKYLWSLFGYSTGKFSIFTGTEMKNVADEMESFLGKKLGNMPDMKVNMLFQYKKPEYITTAHGNEWTDWGKPYYRYHIYQEQQKLLMHIHNSLGHKVLIMYASPAFRDVNDMVTAYVAGKIIEHSNFRTATELDSHHINTYIQAGTHSRAYSEPAEIRNFDLIKVLETFQNDESIEHPLRNSEFVIHFARDVSSVISESAYFSKSFNKLNRLIADYRQHELIYSMLVMRNFRQLTGVQWLLALDYPSTKSAHEVNLVESSEIRSYD